MSVLNLTGHGATYSGQHSKGSVFLRSNGNDKTEAFSLWHYVGHPGMLSYAGMWFRWWMEEKIFCRFLHSVSCSLCVTAAQTLCFILKQLSVSQYCKKQLSVSQYCMKSAAQTYPKMGRKEEVGAVFQKQSRNSLRLSKAR